MKKVNLAEFPELLRCAETIGYTWNGAHDFLCRDGIPPEAECNSCEYYLSDLGDTDEECQYSWSSDTIKVLRAFFAQENVTEFTLVND